MNNQKRKELNKAIELLEQAQSIVESVLEDEDFGFNNLTDGLQQTIRGQEMEAAIDNMNEALDSIDEAIGAIEEATL